ncbi:hypothetical protein P153DRAFT_384359 [Dothidotthia symphoricarpi CBS 119687]|uniref:Uncharacterized protein n=1 Tax=Dothidotthia symphoricarpi CBS 119687 TaxID=1392245 RepID=A0A6A6AHV8_9PLEO|nr:uncharacterized protein P153DRAFT_384359 [Dothidotthia symphoricarpi CBS 119687]KAF2131146.1 hypothetical protein P153DRAFT_384359 [Dothidotthia symphoricarpi CBS 119687]
MKRDGGAKLSGVLKVTDAYRDPRRLGRQQAKKPLSPRGAEGAGQRLRLRSLHNLGPASRLLQSGASKPTSVVRGSSLEACPDLRCSQMGRPRSTTEWIPVPCYSAFPPASPDDQAVGRGWTAQHAQDDAGHCTMRSQASVTMTSAEQPSARASR